MNNPRTPDLDPMCMGQSKNATPSVTIGLPVFNGERYLREALEALLG